MRHWVRKLILGTGILAVSGALVLAASNSGAMAQDAERLVMASGPVTGGYYFIGGAICARLNEGTANHNLRCSVEPSTGSVANLEAIRARKVQLALVQSDWQHHGYEGSATRFAGEKSVSNMRVLASLSGSPFIVLARADSPIGSFADLRGLRVDIGKPGTARRSAMDDLLAANAWDLGAFELASEFSVDEAVDALCAGQIAAVPLVGPSPNRRVRTALQKCNLKLVPVSGTEVDKLIEAKPFYSVVRVPAGIYPGIKTDVRTFGLRIILAAEFTVADTDAYNLVKSLAEDLPALARIHPALRGLTRTELATAGIAAPMHDGATRYFAEAGLR